VSGEVITQPELLDYVVFFETEPAWVHPDGWYYGARFIAKRGEDRIVATVAHDEAEFSFAWWQDSQLRLQFDAVMASGWQLERAPQRELLRLVLDGGRTAVEVQLKPQVCVEWRMAWGWESSVSS
jgi:hypothetical protein